MIIRWYDMIWRARSNENYTCRWSTERRLGTMIQWYFNIIKITSDDDTMIRWELHRWSMEKRLGTMCARWQTLTPPPFPSIRWPSLNSFDKFLIQFDHMMITFMIVWWYQTLHLGLDPSFDFVLCVLRALRSCDPSHHYMTTYNIHVKKRGQTDEKKTEF